MCDEEATFFLDLDSVELLSPEDVFMSRNHDGELSIPRGP